MLQSLFRIVARMAAFCCLAAGPSLFAFGKNKVQVYDQNWFYIRTEHFNVYFDQYGGLIGEYAALHVEEMYDSLSRSLDYELKERVPVILYSSVSEFQNTNIIPQILPEGVGGFTEIFRNRVVIPFDGSYAAFDHTLEHELVHAFMFDMFGNTDRGQGLRVLQAGTPLWFSEGLAEYLAIGWDLGSDMFMLDATAYGYVDNPSRGLRGYLAYKGGQSFYYFLANSFGEQVIPRLVSAVQSTGDLKRAFKAVTGTSLKELGDVWQHQLRAIYWPQLALRRYGKLLGRQLTDHQESLANFYLQPALSPDGKWVAFFSDEEARTSVFLMDVERGRIVRDLITSGGERGHLSFYPRESAIAWSPDSKRIAIVSKSVGKDVISIVDVEDGDVVESIEPPDVHAILSPTWSPDGRHIVFSGLQLGMSDIYSWDRREKKLRRLTSDIALDHNPAVSPSGRWIVFESDRVRPVLPVDPDNPFVGLKAVTRYRDLYRIPFEGGEPELFIGGEYDERMARFGPSDSLVVFVSNRSGLNNLYIAEVGAETVAVRPLTNLLSECTAPSWTPDGRFLAFSLFQNRGYDVFLIRNPLDQLLEAPLPETEWMKVLENPEREFFAPLPPLSHLSSYEPKDLIDTFSVVDTAGMLRFRRQPIGIPPRKRGSRSESPPPVAAAASPGAPAPVAAGPAEPAEQQGGSAKAVPVRLSPGPASAEDSPSGGADLRGSVSGKGSPGQREASPRNEGRTPELAQAEQEEPGPQGGPADDEEGAADPSGPQNIQLEIPADSAPAIAGAHVTDGTRYLTFKGEHEVEEYGLDWGLEMARADIGYNTFGQGIAGGAFLTLSDLMGNHRINFNISSGSQSFRATDAVVIYDYLPQRTDYRLYAFHQGNFLLSTGRRLIFDRYYGGGATLSYPLSIFTRFEGGLESFFLSRGFWQDLINNNPAYPAIEVDMLRPYVSWVNDNALFGIVGPAVGRRMRVGLGYVPPVLQDDYSYVQGSGDFRKYWIFGKRYTLAGRIALGASEAVGGYQNPHFFLAGGADLIPFIAPPLEEENSPEGLVEATFYELALPIRGFQYYDFRGNRMFISNLEFRYPFIEALRVAWPLPFTLRYLMGNVYVDYGGAWQAPEWEAGLDAASDNTGLGYGFGFQLNLGYFVMRYTWGRSWEGIGIGDGVVRQYWALGAVW